MIQIVFSKRFRNAPDKKQLTEKLPSKRTRLWRLMAFSRANHGTIFDFS
jgi:hypothetical protein